MRYKIFLNYSIAHRHAFPKGDAMVRPKFQPFP